MAKMNATPSAHGAVAATPAKAGLKTGAKQSSANKFWKNKGAAARRVAIKVQHGKSGLPTSPTAKGRGVFESDKQQAAFSNPAGVMNHGGGAHTRFVC